MKPMKGLTPLSMWVMRIAVLLFVYVSFFDTVETLAFKSLNFWVAAAFAVFSIMLLIGGFLKTSSITVLSALLLLIISVFKIVDVSSGGLNLSLAIFGLLAAIALFFMASGNRT